MALSTGLDWMERALLVVGSAFLAWSGVTVLEQSYTQRLPVPAAPVVAARLPGENPAERIAAGSGASGASAVEPGTWLARLEGPSVALTATVLEGTDDATLRRGAGHIEGTPFPGAAGNVGIAGHRDTIFRPVRDLKLGDRLLLTTADRVLEYRISETKIVKPADVYVLDPTGRPMLTLVTCFPFKFIGNAPQRFIVHAELVQERMRKDSD
jgi:sortase A